ncbi:MAG: type VI secretion IcmF C-terminal domain-containing protein [Nannocystaceae bacterium]
MRRGERDHLTQRWCNEVVGPFDAMRICYPFNPDGTCSASASEVTELFHPSAAPSGASTKQLSGRFPFQGDRYGVAAEGYGSRLRLNPQVAELLTHAKELGEVLFPGRSEGPRFDFSIQFQPSTQASKITLLVDGTAIEYNNNHNDAFRPISWPGAGGEVGAKIVADTHLGEQIVHREGYWGLFRLIEEGDVDQDRRFIAVKMRVGVAKDVRFLLNPESGSGNPLFGRLRPDARLMDVFRAPRLVVPRNLFVGGMSCKSQPKGRADP